MCLARVANQRSYNDRCEPGFQPPKSPGSLGSLKPPLFGRVGCVKREWWVGKRKRGVAWGLVKRERAKTQWDAERPQGAWRYLRGEGVREHEKARVLPRAQ